MRKIIYVLKKKFRNQLCHKKSSLIKIKKMIIIFIHNIKHNINLKNIEYNPINSFILVSLAYIIASIFSNEYSTLTTAFLWINIVNIVFLFDYLWSNKYMRK